MSNGTPYTVEYGPLSAGDRAWFMAEREPQTEEVFAVRITISRPPTDCLTRVVYDFRIPKRGHVPAGEKSWTELSLPAHECFRTKNELLDSMRDPDADTEGATDAQ